MRYSTSVLFCLASGLALVLVASAGSTAGENGIEQQQQSRSAKLPKLFDFSYFKQSYSKHYKSILEDLARRKYYLSRAFRAFVAGVKYQSRKLNHYLSLNEMSDYSPAEVDMMKNTAEVTRQLRLQRLEAKKAGRKAPPKTLPDDSDKLPSAPELDMSDEEISQRLDQLAQTHPNHAAYSSLLETKQSEARRRKRSLGDQVELGPREPARHLSLDNLLKSKQQVDENSSENSSLPVKLRVPSNNPFYEPLDLFSKGLDDQQEEISWFRVKGANDADNSSPDSYVNQLIQQLGADEKKIRPHIPKIIEENSKGYEDREQYSDEHGQPDEVFVDHRGSCMSMVRQQSKCGSCYAFSAIALLEWVNCRRTGSFTPFSEQYMIDCGRYIDGLLGCGGGDRLAAVKFMHNFGAELRVSYPYRSKQHQCPYPKATDLKTTGYIRPNLGSAVVVPRRKWATYLKYTPLMASIFTDQDFLEYGGGVHEMKSCNRDDSHAMLLVGHGREDGKQYWLFRNSHSVGWGEQGYYKMAKTSNPLCIYMEAYAFGTSNGVKIEARPEINQQYDRSLIQRHNEQLLKQDLAAGAF